MKYVEELIVRIETDSLDESSLLDISEALRLARSKNFVTVSDRLNDEGISENEALLLRSAVFEASRNRLRPKQRFELLLMSLRDGDMRVREEVEFEAARLVVSIREDNSALYQSLMAIQRTDIDVFPAGTTVYSSLNYEENHNAAITYLSRRGLFGDRSKAHFDHLAASPKKQKKQ